MRLYIGRIDEKSPFVPLQSQRGSWNGDISELEKNKRSRLSRLKQIPTRTDTTCISLLHVVDVPISWRELGIKDARKKSTAGEKKVGHQLYEMGDELREQ